MQLKEKGGCKILPENFEEALNFDEEEAKWFRGSSFWIDSENNKVYRITNRGIALIFFPPLQPFPFLVQPCS